MAKDEWCDRCRWRQPHRNGRCLTCYPDDDGPSEKELEDAGQEPLFEIPERKPAA